MSLPGRVLKIEGDEILVEVTPKPECNGCHACTGLLGGEKKSAPRQIKALRGNFSPAIGDEVILDINPGEGSIAAIMVFGLPMLSFFIGLFAAPWLSDQLSFALTDLSRFICAVTGLVSGFMVLAIISRTDRARNLSLKIVDRKGP